MKKNGFLVLHISIFILFFTFFSLSNPHVSHAQSSIGNVSLDGVDIEMSPANPAPGDSVTVDVKSYSTDLNGATINWSYRTGSSCWQKPSYKCQCKDRRRCDNSKSTYY